MNMDMLLLKRICENPNDMDSVKKLNENLLEIMKWSNDNIPNEVERKTFLCNIFSDCLKILDE